MRQVLLDQLVLYSRRFRLQCSRESGALSVLLSELSAFPTFPPLAAFAMAPCAVALPAGSVVIMPRAGGLSQAVAAAAAAPLTPVKEEVAEEGLVEEVACAICLTQNQFRNDIQKKSSVQAMYK